MLEFKFLRRIKLGNSEDKKRDEIRKYHDNIVYIREVNSKYKDFYFLGRIKIDPKDSKRFYFYHMTHEKAYDKKYFFHNIKEILLLSDDPYLIL